MHSALQRAALPFLIFCAVLAGMLLLSALILLPRLTRVEVGGVERNLTGLAQYAAELKSGIAESETKRSLALLPINDPVYRALRAEKQSQPSFLALRNVIFQKAKEAASEPGAVAIQSLVYNEETRTIQMSGDVHSVGVRSMTVLAQYVEALRMIPGVSSLDAPRFVREEDPRIGPHSPFSLTLHL